MLTYISLTMTVETYKKEKESYSFFNFFHKDEPPAIIQLLETLKNSGAPCDPLSDPDLFILTTLLTTHSKYPSKNPDQALKHLTNTLEKDLINTLTKNQLSFDELKQLVDTQEMRTYTDLKSAITSVLLEKTKKLAVEKEPSLSLQKTSNPLPQQRIYAFPQSETRSKKTSTTIDDQCHCDYGPDKCELHSAHRRKENTSTKSDVNTCHCDYGVEKCEFHNPRLYKKHFRN